MQIVDGKICYEIDELPKSQLYKDLGYQIIATDDPKKVLPILKYLLKDEVKFVLEHNLLDECLKGKTIDEYIDNGEEKLIEVVTLKMFKYLREMVKNSPTLGDINYFYEHAFGRNDEDKLNMYINEDEWVEEAAEEFLWEIVSPSLNYILEKYCDKVYKITVSEISEKIYSTSSSFDDMSDEDVIKALKKVDHEDSTCRRITRTFVGYRKKDVSSEEPSEN